VSKETGPILPGAGFPAAVYPRATCWLDRISYIELVTAALLDLAVHAHVAGSHELLRITPGDGQPGKFDELTESDGHFDGDRRSRLLGRRGIGRRRHPNR
jgi:hypothetical protein